MSSFPSSGSRTELFESKERQVYAEGQLKKPCMDKGEGYELILR